MDENQINESVNYGGGKNWMWVLAAVVVIGVLVYFTGSSFFSDLSAINTNNQAANSQTNVSQPIQQQEEQESPDQSNSQSTTEEQIKAFYHATRIDANGLTCYDNPSYFVVTKDGSNNIVKYKTSANQTIPCEYIVGKNDFEFGNGAEYFMGFDGKFLLTDSGTGPGCRGLTIYDLDNKKNVYQDSYCRPITMDGAVISYWTPTKIKPDNANCPNLSEYLSQTGSAEIESHVSINLDTLVKKDLGGSRCSVTQ